jgi:hypothetical protein
VSQPPLGGQKPAGQMSPTRTGTLVVSGLVAMVGGWLLRPVTERLDGTAPVVTWLQVFVLFFVAGLVAVTAGVTWRSLQVRREWLEPHRAVNRLVMAKASALAGALMAGGYTGYAVSWLGLEAELAGQRIARSLLAGLAGLLITIAALVLERACRARFSDDET